MNTLKQLLGWFDWLDERDAIAERAEVTPERELTPEEEAKHARIRERVCNEQWRRKYGEGERSEKDS